MGGRLPNGAPISVYQGLALGTSTHLEPSAVVEFPECTYIHACMHTCLCTSLLHMYLDMCLHIYKYMHTYVYTFEPNMIIHISYIYIYICYPPPLRSMDFRLLGRGRLRVFSNYLIQTSCQHENSLNWLLV